MQQANDAQAIWQAWMDLGFLWAQRDYGQAGERFQHALATARRMDDPLLLAHTLKHLITAGAYACLYNVLGYPAGVVPVTRVRADEQVGRKSSADLVEKAALRSEIGSAGLPIGVQVIARPWRDHLALAAMQAIEQVARTRADFPQTPVKLG